MQQYTLFERPDPGPKVCTDCHQAKQRDEFYSSKYTRDGLDGICKVCRGKRATAVWHNNRKRTRDGVYRRLIKREYDLSPEQYNAICEVQGGRCAICNRFPDESHRRNVMLSVDHDHVTGKVRGLLCTNCNQMIGNAGDRVDVLKWAILYLERYQE